MITRKGIVTQVIEVGLCGVIRDGMGREFYFAAKDCAGGLPEVGAQVSFIKDPDFKATDVAYLIEPVTPKKAA